jgi:branched-subunit amino acid aminotransferase/4-amino-4-deoxychorismate lyase
MAAEAEAKRRGADDAVFLADGEVVLEGPVTNVWWRRGATLFTPGAELGILPGVTRATILEEAADAGYEVAEGAYTLEDLGQADEAFTSSSVREIVPVVAVNDLPIAYGRPGPAAAELQARLRARAGAG